VTAAEAEKGLILGTTTDALSLLTRSAAAATYTFVKGGTNKIIFSNGATAITVGNGLSTENPAAAITAPATAKIKLGISENALDAIKLGNGSTLTLAIGAKIGVFTSSPGTIQTADVSDAIGGAVLSGTNAVLTNVGGTLTVSGGAGILTGATAGNSTIAAGATFAGGT
jgi:hypothetical protein